MGGYFNEGIVTSYPNLIARQMKLQKFEQPLFDATDYNGFGRKVRTGFNPTGGPVPKFNEVKNNSGVASVGYDGIKLKKSKGDFENFAFKNGGADFNMFITEGQTIESKLNTEYYRRVVPKESNLSFGRRGITLGEQRDGESPLFGNLHSAGKPTFPT